MEGELERLDKERVLFKPKCLFVGLVEGVGVHDRPSASADNYIQYICLHIYWLCTYILVYHPIPYHGTIQQSDCGTFHSWSYFWNNLLEIQKTLLL
jgi:hypothetical protein